ncbi:hypothetical protein BJX68DRAFT_252650 [Aspergillus pseudodeflectus]|uniref:Cytochrome b561 domain-containing protein n=1 Tax=Aspergillus pseudodeflectus TaxID=176178 RepID=A0ABR4L2P6_9EURO
MNPTTNRALSWVVFPIGLVLGIGTSRWHVPTQVLGTVLAIAGFFLGHAHSGREYTANNIHASFSWILQILLVAQVVFGLYLKRHWEKGQINRRARTLLRPCHSVLGKLMPILSWAQMLFGGITALGFCQGDYLGQCAARFIMGGAFIAYGVLLTIILLVGQLWLRRRGRSQEFYDSAHRWGTAWVRNDWQHTAIGNIWWCAGVVGMWLSWDHHSKKPKRSFVPGAVLFVTGWTMSAHPQELMVSAATHAAFGFALMAAGVSRTVEIAFILRDEPSVGDGGRGWNSFQLFLYFASMPPASSLWAANAEQMPLTDASSNDHVSYILILLSVAYIVFLFANVLVCIYDRLSNAQPNNVTDYPDGHVAGDDCGVPVGEGEFELCGLMSDDDDDNTYDDDPDESKRMLDRGGSSFEGNRSSTLGRVGN